METRVIVLKSCLQNSIVINKLIFTDPTRVVTLSPMYSSIGKKNNIQNNLYTKPAQWKHNHFEKDNKRGHWSCFIDDVFNDDDYECDADDDNYADDDEDDYDDNDDV